MFRTIAGVFMVLMFLISTGPFNVVRAEEPVVTKKSDEYKGGEHMPAFRPSPEFYRVQALINLLVRKGIITEEEFREEVMKMKRPQK